MGSALLPDFRRFAPATRGIDRAWSSGWCSGDAWQPTGVAWQTNTSPVQVQTASGLTGVQKPGNATPNNPFTAATEKIVADLAYILALPVPPVTLWDRGAAAGVPRHVAVSAWAYGNVLQWGQAEAGLTAAQRDALLPWASAMIPFESWIGAEDRTNAANVLVGLDQNGEALGAWIDYAFALDHVWKGNHIQGCSIPPMYPRGCPEGWVADRVAAMDNAAIEGIINRIPTEYLPRAIADNTRAIADNIIRNLLSRRASVRALL